MIGTFKIINMYVMLFKLIDPIIVICISYNTGKSPLPDIYVLALGCAYATSSIKICSNPLEILFDDIFDDLQEL